MSHDKQKTKPQLTALLVIIMLYLQDIIFSKNTIGSFKRKHNPKAGFSNCNRRILYIEIGQQYLCTGRISGELRQIGQYLADKLKISTGFGIEVKSTVKAPRVRNIYLTMPEADTKLGDEGYELKITKKGIKLAANNPAGLFRGIQTIRQLLPAKIEMTSKQTGPWKIATGTITDYPVYSYRGAMLDVSRHFFGVEDVKRLIDFLACYKMNVLHLHLSDDQGWRIEIKSWPNLATHGGSTQVGEVKEDIIPRSNILTLCNMQKIVI